MTVSVTTCICHYGLAYTHSSHQPFALDIIGASEYPVHDTILLGALGVSMYYGYILIAAGDYQFRVQLQASTLSNSFLKHLPSLDSDLHQGLIFLKHYTSNPVDLSLNFIAVEGMPLVLLLYTMRF
jgi:hypothetical protein